MTDAAPLLLMTPGPTRVPEQVLRAGSRPMIHHRTPEFSAELAVMLELLPPLFGTREPVLPVHATGRGAIEATLSNLFSPGDEIAVCCNGRFGGSGPASLSHWVWSCIGSRLIGNTTSIRMR